MVNTKNFKVSNIEIETSWYGEEPVDDADQVKADETLDHTDDTEDTGLDKKVSKTEEERGTPEGADCSAEQGNKVETTEECISIKPQQEIDLSAQQESVDTDAKDMAGKVLSIKEVYIPMFSDDQCIH